MQNHVRRSILGICCLFALVSVGAHAQSAEDQASASVQMQSLNCSDPNSPAASLCAQYQLQRPSATRDTNVYVDQAGEPGNRQTAPGEDNALQRRVPSFPPDPITDLQRLAKDSSGQLLPIFGRDLFRKPPSTFAPANQVPVMPDYVIGPGDQILLRIWGHNSFNGQLTVDRTGSIYIPEVGAVHVAGQRFSELRPQLQHELSRVFRNFQFSVDLGQLRSIQVFVLGEARQPGSYTLSSLATVFNALLASGGPTVQGSMRNIELRRSGKTIATLDLYDELRRGDKSNDLPLQPGDVIFIPFVGPEAAISGSVRHPAIYELKGETTVSDLLALAGGLSATASDASLTIDRIAEHTDRIAMNLKLDAAGLATSVQDGDVIQASSMLRAFKDSVTLRGNVASPERFSWHPGMKLSEIIPDRESLLTPEYWRERNRLGLPTPLFQPLPSTRTGALRQSAYEGQAVEAAMLDDQQELGEKEDSGLALNASRRTAKPGTSGAGSSLAEEQESATDRLTPTNARKVQITLPAPEIDWSYAVIERLDPKSLKTILVPFNLGKLVNDHDESEDKLLQPGDVVTILSQRDIHVSTDEQPKFVRLEGEFRSAGVYSVGPNDTLRDVVRRAGGLTSKAYLYGSSFTRESARVLQQARMDEYVSQMSALMERSSAERTVSSTSPFGTDFANQQRMLNTLRQMRATGRVVLQFKPDSSGIDSVPDIPLENGDTFTVPSRPLMVSVIGAVYGQNVFVYTPGRRVRDYLALAGTPNRVADKRNEFIIRADGSTFSAHSVRGGLWSQSFEDTPLHPGDTIVVPEKPIKPSAMRDVIDWSQLFSQFALGAASLDAVMR